MDAATIREELDHPVIDADGHIIEFIPAIRDLIAADAGTALADTFQAMSTAAATARRGLTDDQRRSNGMSRTGWWGVPTRNTLDRAPHEQRSSLHSET